MTLRPRLLAAFVLTLGPAAWVAASLPQDSGAARSAVPAAEIPGAVAAQAGAPLDAPLLPPGTVVDEIRWDGTVLELDLTLPGPDVRPLSPLEIEDLAAQLAAAFRPAGDFGGTRIRVRIGPDAPYGSLALLGVPEPEPLPGDEPQEQPLPWTPPQPGDRGPVAQAARQPAGALSGVVVFTTAGHGWTAGTSSWYLQRPVLWTMNEDYGNLDMLNYFVHYAFNAGATVVPFRPVGWQPLEIVLDNDDPGVTFTGAWSNGSSSKYYENGVTNSGIVYKWTSAAGSETATARYTPNITVTDYYPVYCFTIAGSNRALQTYRIKHGGGISAVTIDHRQVGSGWIWLGDYYLVAGDANYVEITNQSPTGGAIIADAIRWGGGVGDVVRPGPGTVSGYSRDEECMRYWAESELGNNAVGFDSTTWDVPDLDDGSDNVRVAAKWAREMNQEPAGGVLVERWKRIYLEFHTNASGGGARGQICLITDLGATTYQTQFATILSDEVDADMVARSAEFEHAWVDRSEPTYTSSYGAICTPANGNEFDATIVELAFHDNQQDAELLRDPRVRSAMAKSCVEGIIRFLNSLPGSTVPLVFPPDTPRSVRAIDAGGGNVTLAWQAPLTGTAYGDAATGYVIYRSANGFGFGDPILLGNVTAYTLTGVPVGETRYFRIAATNAGGESMPSEVLAVRRPATGVARVLIVNGFDRLRRQINPRQTFTQPPAYAGQTIERQMWRLSNAFDYVVEHAEALAANNLGFSSCVNDAVVGSFVNLGDFSIVDWILGTESSEDQTLSTTEQSRLTTFLTNGGSLLISGSELAYHLGGLGGGTAFLQDRLKVSYVADNAGTYAAVPVPGGIFDGLPPLSFSPAGGARYDVRSPDVLAARTGGTACLNYSGGAGGVAGVQVVGAQHNIVTLGFPFETISPAATRAAVMGRIMTFLQSATPPLPFDYDNDGDVDIADFTIFAFCGRGPEKPYTTGHLCLEFDGDGDADVDLADFQLMQLYINAP